MDKSKTYAIVLNDILEKVAAQWLVNTMQSMATNLLCMV